MRIDITDLEWIPAPEGYDESDTTLEVQLAHRIPGDVEEDSPKYAAYVDGEHNHGIPDFMRMILDDDKRSWELAMVDERGEWLSSCCSADIAGLDRLLADGWRESMEEWAEEARADLDR